MRNIRNRPLYQSRGSYLRTLAELERRARADVPLKFYDDDTPGEKNIECTLGLCADSVQELQDGIYQTEGQTCPHDKRSYRRDGEPTGEPGNPMGCFYHCWVFQTPNPQKAEAQRRILAVAVRLGASRVEEPQPTNTRHDEEI